MTSLELLLVLTSALLHAAWSISIKRSTDPLCFNLLQKIAPVAALLAAIPVLDPAILTPALCGFVAATGIAHGAYLYWMSRAYEHGDLTLVYPIARSTPAFLPLVAVPLLGESISPVGCLGIGIVVAGIWLVQGTEGLRAGVLLSPAARYAYLTLAATVGYSLLDKAAMLELGAMGWKGPLPRAVVYSLLLWSASAAVYGPLVLRARGLRGVVRCARADLGAAVLASLVSFSGYALVLAALRTAPVSYVVTVRQSSVIFALALGALMLRERPDRRRILGAGATVVGVALVSLAG